jgi:hypothetical protein
MYFYCYVCNILCILHHCVVLCIFVCKCVLYYCHRVSTQMQLTNISYTIYEVLQIHVIYTENCKGYEEKVQISRSLYKVESNENLKSAIKIRNTARLSCKLAGMILIVWRMADRWQYNAGMQRDGAVVG